MQNYRHDPNGTVGYKLSAQHVEDDIDFALAADADYIILAASTELMQVMARACGHDHLGQFGRRDLASWKRDAAELAGSRWAGCAGG